MTYLLFFFNGLTSACFWVLWMVCKPCKYCIWAWEATPDFLNGWFYCKGVRRTNNVHNQSEKHSFTLFNYERGKVCLLVCVFTFWMQRSLWYFCILPVVLWCFLNDHPDRLKESKREMLICVWSRSHRTLFFCTIF